MPLDKRPWTDDTVMPWGPHKGAKLRDLPPDHLLWLSEQRWLPDWPGLRAYIQSPAIVARIEKRREERKSDATIPDAYRTFDDYLSDWR